MKIAQIAPRWKSLPPRGTSDSERTLAYLTEELVRRGHNVTLFGNADSRTGAQLETPCAAPFSGKAADWGRAGATIRDAEQAFEIRANEFDIVHSHFGIGGFPMAQRCATPTLTTLQERLDFPEYISLFEQFPDLPLVSTSDAQRRTLAWASWQQTIYPGVPAELYGFNPQPGNYLAFLGSLSLDEGLGLAIEVARRAHLPLRVASRQDEAEGVPCSLPIELLIANPYVEWLGELCEEEKNDFLGEALALVCTATGPGSCGLCVAEALACGTPVVAFDGGLAAEMIYDHVTGFTCESINEMVEMLPLIGDLDRRECRAAFEKQFSTARMAEHYLSLYQRLIDASRSPRGYDASVVKMVQPDIRPMTVPR